MKTLIPAGGLLRKSLITCVTMFLLATTLNAQITLNSRLHDAEIKVSGTSNLHDWTMKGNGLNCDAQFIVKNASIYQLMSLNGLVFKMPVINLKSSENLLNTRAYKAMNAEKHKDINFRMVTATVTPQGENQYVIKAIGSLTISGVTKEVTLVANSKVNADKTVSVTGSKKIKMSEFGIKPPSFMLGALKTGDEVTIDYSLKFNGTN
ncbi:MAG TPA: YceI family protein [Chitinophagaceae bacterium]